MACQGAAGIAPVIDSLKMLMLRIILGTSCRAGGCAGTGVAVTEIAATTPKQIAAQKSIWRPWDLNPLEDGGMSIVLILMFSIERTRTSFLLNKRLFRLTYLLRAVSRKKLSHLRWGELIPMIGP